MKGRTLQDALEFTPEVKSFITKSDVATEWQQPKKEALETPPDSDAEGESPRALKKVRKKRTQRNTESKSIAQPKRVLVTLGTRIDANVKESLDEVCFRRKQARNALWRQQDIVEMAISDWLQRNSK